MAVHDIVAKSFMRNIGKSYGYGLDMSYEFVVKWYCRQVWEVFFGPPWIFGERVKKIELTFSGNAAGGWRYAC